MLPWWLVTPVRLGKVFFGPRSAESGPYGNVYRFDIPLLGYSWPSSRPRRTVLSLPVTYHFLDAINGHDGGAFDTGTVVWVPWMRGHPKGMLRESFTGYVRNGHRPMYGCALR